MLMDEFVLFVSNIAIITIVLSIRRMRSIQSNITDSIQTSLIKTLKWLNHSIFFVSDMNQFILYKMLQTLNENKLFPNTSNNSQYKLQTIARIDGI